MNRTLLHSRPVPWWIIWLLLGLLVALRVAPLLPSAPAWPSAIPSVNNQTWVQLRIPVGVVLADGTLELSSQVASGPLRLVSDRPVLVTGSIQAAGSITLRAPQLTIRGQLDAPAIHLESTGLISVDSGAQVRARVGTNGGPITVQAQTLHLHGSLDADGQHGGPITIVARTLYQGGVLTSAGQHGGVVQVITSEAYVAMQGAQTSVQSTQGTGGTLSIRAERLFSSGQYQATGPRGGQIAFLGADLTLVATRVDARGTVGGGTIQVGSHEVITQRVLVTAASALAADAQRDGPGGTITIWAGDTTEVAGTLTARGGVVGGAGGQIDISTPGALRVDGQVDASAPVGQAGMLWLDPKNITIGSAGVFPQYQLINPTPSAGDQFGAIIQPLPSGNVVVTDPGDDSVATDAGAVYLYQGQTGALVSTLTGATADDAVGAGVTFLTNGNYVVHSPNWDNGALADVGAATWGNGAMGMSGPVSSSNSLVGATTNDRVGLGVTALTNGNYVISSPNWDNGAVINAGAATWGNGTSGSSGPVSSSNSIVGSATNDQVSVDGVTALTNGDYVVKSPNWDNGAVGDTGAATWGNGTTGTSGVVSSSNSLVGSTVSDLVSAFGVLALSNGSYVVSSPLWDNGAVANVGAATWGNGTTGTSGIVSSSNSLVGSTASDLVSSSGVVALTNGNYVVSSSNWDNGAVANVGAATWGNGTTGTSGIVSSSNSLIGSTASDRVGIGGVAALTNGNYVVINYNWNNGAAADAGAATWGNGTTGTSGPVSSSNSLVGSTASDLVSIDGVTALTNGNYVVRSSNWDNGALADVGAATWGNGATGISGSISSSNSLVGSSASDFVSSSGVAALANGNYVVSSELWDNGAVADAGAATWGNGASGQPLDGSATITPQNSLLGQIASAGLGAVNEDVTNQTFLVRFTNENGGRVAAGFTDPSLLTFTRTQAQTITVTPGFLARTLNTGTAVTLQASNDLTLADPLIVNNPAGAGGALTLQAGRSILLNANLTTDNGALTLIANERLANGVVDAQRDAGAAGITMASGASINAGSGSVTLDLHDGAGKTNPASGVITLTTISAGTLTVANGVLALGTSLVTVNGSVNFAETSALQTTITGSGAGQFGQLAVNGTLNLGNAALTVTGGAAIAPLTKLTLIANDDGDVVSGAFAMISEGGLLVSSDRSVFLLTYAGASGNDVVLTRAARIFLPPMRR